MSDCCSVKRPPKKASCINCQKTHKSVSLQTMLQHVASPFNRSIPNSNFYFCATPECETVYFSACGYQYTVHQVRGLVGQKQPSTNSDKIICYCFDVSEQQVLDELANTGESESRAFVTLQTKEKNCACDIRNPSGLCCLKSFPTMPKAAKSLRHA